MNPSSQEILIRHIFQLLFYLKSYLAINKKEEGEEERGEGKRTEK